MFQTFSELGNYCALIIRLYFGSVYSIIAWIAQSAFTIDRHRFIKKHLMPSIRSEVKKDKQQLAEFTANYLGADGVFVLRLLLANTDDIGLTDITTALWENYQKVLNNQPLEEIGSTDV